MSFQQKYTLFVFDQVMSHRRLCKRVVAYSQGHEVLGLKPPKVNFWVGNKQDCNQMGVTSYNSMFIIEITHMVTIHVKCVMMQNLLFGSIIKMFEMKSLCLTQLPCITLQGTVSYYLPFQQPLLMFYILLCLSYPSSNTHPRLLKFARRHYNSFQFH